MGKGCGPTPASPGLPPGPSQRLPSSAPRTFPGLRGRLQEHLLNVLTSRTTCTITSWTTARTTSMATSRILVPRAGKERSNEERENLLKAFVGSTHVRWRKLKRKPVENLISVNLVLFVFFARFSFRFSFQFGAVFGRFSSRYSFRFSCRFSFRALLAFGFRVGSFHLLDNFRSMTESYFMIVFACPEYVRAFFYDGVGMSGAPLARPKVRTSKVRWCVRKFRTPAPFSFDKIADGFLSCIMHYLRFFL